jgi:tripartite-type tricarboxylate transporter receptor subunit TctC
MSTSGTNHRRALLGASLATLAAAASPSVRAQAAFPTKPIRLITGFPAGSATDGICRAIAEPMRQKLGQPVIVENRAGANGAVGAAEVARAAPDGHTLLVTNSSSIVVNPQLYKKIGYLPERDFIPLTMAIQAPFIMTINPANERLAGVNSVAELVAIARAKPGQITFGSGGPGNLAHLSFEMINNRVGIKTTHVPYKSGVLAQIGVLGKEIDVLLDTPNTVPNVKSGKLKALAVTTATRWRDLPDVPTLAESGYPGFDVSFWLGVFAPAQTPPAVLQTLYAAIRSSRDDPAALQGLNAQGTVELTEPQAFAARIKAETALWGEVLGRKNIQLD